MNDYSPYCMDSLHALLFDFDDLEIFHYTFLQPVTALLYL